jgi:hypothetical protein
MSSLRVDRSSSPARTNWWRCSSKASFFTHSTSGRCRAPATRLWMYSTPPNPGGNPDPLPGEHEQRPAGGCVFEPTTAALQDQAMGQTALPSSRKPPCRAIFGSPNAASEQDYARRGRPIREGFTETCAIGDGGRGTGTLPGRLAGRRARVCRTKGHTGATSAARSVEYTLEELSLDRTRTERAGCQTKFHPPPRSVAIQGLGLHEIRKTAIAYRRQAIFRSHSRRLPYNTGPPDRRVISGLT